MDKELLSLCEDYVNGNVSDDSRQELTSRIVQKSSDILHLIQALRLYLTSTNLDHRLAATKLLSQVLVANSGTLLKEDVHYLAEFFCDRLKDRVIMLPPVLTGLLAIVRHDTLQDSDVVLITRSIFKEVHCQSLQYDDRHCVFNIFLELLTDHMSVLQAIEEEVVLGSVEVMAGERDPRNLLLAFSCITLILHHLHFDALLEEIFDVVSCYFPIDFSPPPGDGAVTRDALVLGLRQCLTATAKFGKLSLPLLLEKLSSDVLSAKLDSLDTLVHGASVYGTSVLSTQAEPLWLAIKTEMFKSSHREVQVGCVAAVKAVTSSLSSPLTSRELDDFITMVLQDSQRHLSEPGLRLMEPVVQLLAGVAMASEQAASTVMVAVMPVLLVQYSASVQVTGQKTVLDALLIFVKAACSATTSESSNGEAGGPLLSCRPDLLQLLSAALHSTDSRPRVVAMQVLAQVTKTGHLLDVPQLLEYSQYLKELALATPPDMALATPPDMALATPPDSSKSASTCDGERGAIQCCLATVCLAKPELARDHLIAPLLSDLSAGYYGNLWLLPHLCPSPVLAQVVVTDLVEATHRLLAQEQLSTGVWADVMLVSRVLLQVLQQLQEVGVVPVAPPTLQSLLLSCSSAVLKGNAVEFSLWVELVADVVGSCARHGDVSWSEGAMSMLLDRVSLEAMTDTCTPDYLYVPIVTALLQASPAKLVDVWGERLCPVMFKIAALPADDTATIGAAKGYASIVNKCGNEQWLQDLLKEHTAALWATLGCHGDVKVSTGDHGHGALRVWVWLTKALVMRGHHEGLPAANKLLGLCTCSDVLGKEAADGCQLIMTDLSDVLNRQCYAVVKLFYKQQLFAHLLPQLIRLVSQVEEGNKQHLLLALSYLLASVPQQVVLGELHKVLPLLLESLCSGDTSVKASSLTAVLGVLQDTPTSFSTHLQALVSQLLVLTSDPTSMIVRKLALQCVGVVPALPTHLVYPFKQRVIKALAPSLDDRKRVVRKAAVEARALWYLL